ncbi:hypothetical protein NQ315_003841 [Exocentrus adspersus]|uniref:Sushi domain-containing protein n=1 Tax=Exocentrus adspersus TaxID=1586481 RepID=A0AAV8VY49_9CUCU|nr:hypothetical protein NQ315_003841 [Exocentrus adspersus]
MTKFVANRVVSSENAGDFPCDDLPTVLHSHTDIIQESDRRSNIGIQIRCLGKYRNSLSPCQPTKLKCERGKWVGVLPTCVPAYECFPPPLVPYATIVDVNYNLYDASNPTSFPVKSTVTYQCLQGFVLEGEPIMTCTTGGCWSPSDPPICIRVRTPPTRPSSGSYFLAVDNINAILMSAAAGAGVLGILLLICLMVACTRKKQHTTTVAIPQPLPRHDMGDHAVLLEHPDRLALIAFADGVQRSQNFLPSYDEAVRSERGATLSATRPHRPHWPNLAGGRRTRNSPNPEVGHVTRHGSFASHTPSTRSVGDSMGSTDTVAVSEGSTNVTLDTASSHSGSQPASCRAHCGSLASFDACSVVNTEDVPLLEESELEEIQGGS